MGGVFGPLTIGGQVTGGKGALVALLDGHPAISSMCMWHDGLSALLCLLPESLEAAHPETHRAFHGSFNSAFLLRQLLMKYSDWYNRLETISHQGYFMFHVSSHERVKISLPAPFDFYAFDACVMRQIWGMEVLEPDALFRLITSALLHGLGKELAQDARYAVSMANNDFDEYGKLVTAYPDGKVIYIVRDHAEAVAAKLLRARSVQDDALLSLIQTEYIHHAPVHERAFSTGQKILRLAAECPDKIFIANFIDIIEKTEQTMRAVCTWLQVDYAPLLSVPSFFGEAMPGSISGKVHDSMDALSPVEREAIHWYADYRVKGTRQAGGPLYFPPFTCVSERTPDSNGVLSLPVFEHETLLFSGPYLPVFRGVWRVAFSFTAQGIPDSSAIQLRLICNDMDGGTYFDVSRSLPALASPVSSIVLGEEKVLYFRAYASGGIPMELKFHGITLTMDSSDDQGLSSAQEPPLWRRLGQKALREARKFFRGNPSN